MDTGGAGLRPLPGHRRYKAARRVACRGPSGRLRKEMPRTWYRKTLVVCVRDAVKLLHWSDHRELVLVTRLLYVVLGDVQRTHSCTATGVDGGRSIRPARPDSSPTFSLKATPFGLVSPCAGPYSEYIQLRTTPSAMGCTVRLVLALCVQCVQTRGGVPSGSSCRASAPCSRHSPQARRKEGAYCVLSVLR